MNRPKRHLLIILMTSLPVAIAQAYLHLITFQNLSWFSLGNWIGMLTYHPCMIFSLNFPNFHSGNLIKTGMISFHFWYFTALKVLSVHLLDFKFIRQDPFIRGLVLAALYLEKSIGLLEAQDFVSRIIFECNEEDFQTLFFE